MEPKNLTLRDYFAAQALIGLLSNPTNIRTGVEEVAYGIADEMIKQRTIKPIQEGGDSDE